MLRSDIEDQAGGEVAAAVVGQAADDGQENVLGGFHLRVALRIDRELRGCLTEAEGDRTGGTVEAAGTVPALPATRPHRSANNRCCRYR